VKRAIEFKHPVLLLLILVAAMAWPATASALVAPTAEGGKVGYLPLNPGAAPGAQPLHATVPTGVPPLEWHGGPVMTSHEAFAIFWAPSGYSFPSGYQAAITKYFEDVAADSWHSTNVYSVSAQYFGSNGFVNYEDSFGGSVVDATPYPTSGTCPTYSGFEGASYTACLTDAIIREEAEAVVEDEGWPTGLGAAYYVVLPPEVGSCFEVSGSSPCFDRQYCAYHGFSPAMELVYANISYAPGDPVGCGVGEYPNGHANGNADDTFSSISHEANESITDPELNAWYDEHFLENGDECRLTPFEEDYGPALGGFEEAETLFNEEIGSGHYYLQQEWSNDIEDCAQRVGPATPVISGPTSAAPGQVVKFDGSSSIPGDGGIEFYEWEFGDGTGEEGEEAEKVTHSYSAPGTYTVTLTVYDDGGFGYSKSRQISVKAPEVPPHNGPTPTPTPPTPPVPPAIGVAVVGAKAKVNSGAAALKLKCVGAGACSGVVKLLDHGVIGHAGFNLAAGASKLIKVRLTSAGLALLAKKVAGLKVSLSGTGVRHRTLTLIP
jgi:PKD domain